MEMHATVIQKQTCPECAREHAPEEPHHKDSILYTCIFFRRHGRMPTWEDAMAHCPVGVKQLWRDRLSKMEGMTTDCSV